MPSREILSFGYPIPISDPNGELLHVLYCKICTSVRLQRGTYRIVFCPSCFLHDGSYLPEKVLCCADCEKPLAVVLVWRKNDEGEPEVLNGSHCMHCGYSPSMQDTFLWEREAERETHAGLKGDKK